MNKCLKCGTEYDGAERFCPKDGSRLGTTAEGKAVSTAPPPKDPLVDSIIDGRYHVLQQIGEGGMGVVYVAEHVGIQKKVALKVLRDDFSKRPEVVARFKQEAISASKIGNAHIVDVTDFGQLENGGVYFVMEYLEGQSVSDLIFEGIVPVERAVSIVKQIATALSAAHQLGIVHRDLKPDNIFLIETDERKDFVKILDFGIAKISDRDSEGQRLTKTGMIFGTPEYMSPEQAAGKPMDHRVDVYALGCIMFEMFTGNVPFEGETFMAVLTQHMFEPVPDIKEINPQSDVSPSIRAVVYKAMAKENGDRYSDMNALARDLERAMDDSGYVVPQAISDVAGYKKRKALKETLDWAPELVERKDRNKKWLLVAAISIGLLAAVGAYGFLRVEEPTVETPTNKIVDGEPSDLDKGSGEEKDTEKQEELVTSTQDSTKDTELKKQEKISILINSDPEGAVIVIEGMGQVCSKAPCDLEVVLGQPIEILAKLKGNESKMTFTPSAQNKELTLSLKKSGKRIPKKPKGKTGRNGSGRPMSGAGNSGLKIPDMFKDN